MFVPQCDPGTIHNQSATIENDHNCPNPADQISIFNLNTDILHLLPAHLYGNRLLEEQLGSQGFFSSACSTYASHHETSVPLSYNLNEAGFPYVINMDRGGVLTKSDGSHAACIADGVGGTGYFSAFVAQMICEFFFNIFSEKSATRDAMDFSENVQHNRQIAQTTALYMIFIQKPMTI
jgi:hypothetical protein